MSAAPTSEAELLQRARRLAGRTFAELAATASRIRSMPATVSRTAAAPFSAAAAAWAAMAPTSAEADDAWPMAVLICSIIEAALATVRAV
ncbi:MAG: hypothetical protein ACK4N5_11390, partial [Myxococcales bacterium]